MFDEVSKNAAADALLRSSPVRKFRPTAPVGVDPRPSVRPVKRFLSSDSNILQRALITDPAVRTIGVCPKGTPGRRRLPPREDADKPAVNDESSDTDWHLQEKLRFAK